MKPLAFILCFALMPLLAVSQESEIEKIEEAVDVIKDLQDLPIDGEEDIPAELMEEAEAIVIVPKLRKGGLVVGGKFGKGFAMFKDENGNWSDPTFIKLAGGSIGFQVGYTSSDILLVFRNANTLKKLTTGKGKFTLGGDAAVAAGPKGRTASANTDLDFEAEILSYSRSRGIFAGVSLDGSELKLDSKANRNFYGDAQVGKDIVRSKESGIKSISALDKLKSLLNRF